MLDIVIIVIRDTLFYFLRALEIILLLYIIFSWLPINQSNPIVKFVKTASYPMISIARKLMNKSVFGNRASIIDFSPFIVFIVLNYLQTFIMTEKGLF